MSADMSATSHANSWHSTQFCARQVAHNQDIVHRHILPHPPPCPLSPLPPSSSSSTTHTHAVSQSDVVYNKLLARSAELRQQMPSATAVSLQASLNGLWQRVVAEQRPHLEQQQQQGVVPSTQSRAAPDSQGGGQQQQHGTRQPSQQAGIRGQQQRRRQSGSDRGNSEAEHSLLESMINWWVHDLMQLPTIVP